MRNLKLVSTLIVLIILVIGGTLYMERRNNLSEEKIINTYSMDSWNSLLIKISQKVNPDRILISSAIKQKLMTEDLSKLELDSLLIIDRITAPFQLRVKNLEAEIISRLASGEIRNDNFKELLLKRQRLNRIEGDEFDVYFILSGTFKILKLNDIGEICNFIDFYKGESKEARCELDLNYSKNLLTSFRNRGLELIESEPHLSIDSLYALRLSNLFGKEGNRIIDSIGSSIVRPLIFKSQDAEELLLMGSFAPEIVDPRIFNLLMDGKVKSLERLASKFKDNPSIAKRLNQSRREIELRVRSMELSRLVNDENLSKVTRELVNNDKLYDESIHLALVCYSESICEKYISSNNPNFKEALRKWLTLEKVIRIYFDNEKPKEISRVFQRAFQSKGMNSHSDQAIHSIAKALGLSRENYYAKTLTGESWYMKY